MNTSMQACMLPTSYNALTAPSLHACGTSLSTWCCCRAQDFRGRPPSTKALLRDENLLPSKGSVTAAVQAQSLDL